MLNRDQDNQEMIEQTREMVGSSSQRPRRVVVLGLQLDTSVDTLKKHFTKFGGVESVEIVSDKQTAKSRGFGFVTFNENSAALQALQTKHKIDGKNCDVKVAHKRGPNDGQQSQTTRIFVAKILPSVSEEEFRKYFEKFGEVQDSYMPLKQNKQSYRGFGFVTFASSQSVDLVMGQQHRLHGQELAIDRANPKDETAVKHGLGALHGVHGLHAGLHVQHGIPGIGGHGNTISNLAAAFLGPQNAAGLGLPMPRHGQGMHGDIATARGQQGMQSNPVLANARAGPRIFVGKLSKEISEQDVRQYFMQYGYVLDVYLPKAKDNKLEHRGFGFVTFETEAAVQRVVAHGVHKLKSSVLAIDVAVPRKEEVAFRHNMQQQLLPQPHMPAGVPPPTHQQPPYVDPSNMAQLPNLLQRLQYNRPPHSNGPDINGTAMPPSNLPPTNNQQQLVYNNTTPRGVTDSIATSSATQQPELPGNMGKARLADGLTNQETRFIQDVQQGQELVQGQMAGRDMVLPGEQGPLGLAQLGNSSPSQLAAGGLSKGIGQMS